MSGLRIGVAQQRLVAWRRWGESSVQATFPVCPSCYANLLRRQQRRKVNTEGRRSPVSAFRDYGAQNPTDEHTQAHIKRPALSSTTSAVIGREHPEALPSDYRRFGPTLKAHSYTTQNYFQDINWKSTIVRPLRTHIEAKLIRALRLKDSQMILDILEEASNDQNQESLRSIPRATWSEVIRAFHPRSYSSSYHRMHRSLNPNSMRNIGFAHPRQQARFLNLIENLLASLRGFVGLKLSLADYRTLLGFAGFRGNVAVAKSIWSNMKDDGIRPDLKCYNSLMEALLYAEESRLQQKRLGKGWFQNPDLPQHTRITLYNTDGLEEVNDIFLEMSKQGIRGDTQTICLVLTAMGRLGDLEGAASLLKQAWGIDVSSVESGEDAPKERITRSTSSPLYPNSKLLNTIADVYGMNDRIPLALRLVDLTSRQFGVEVGKNTWYRLLQWMWIYARRDLDENPEGSARKLDDVHMLASMMLGQKGISREPLEICHILFKTSYERDCWDQAPLLAPMNAGRLLYAQAVKNYRIAARDLKALETPHTSSHLIHKSQPTLSNQVRNLRISIRQHAAYLKRWATNCVRRRIPWNWQPNLETLLKAEDWWYRDLQDFLTEWSDWVPSIVKYSTTSGIIELNLDPASTATGQKDFAALNNREVLWLGKRRSTPQV